MLTTSLDIIRRFQQEGWTLIRVTGSHRSLIGRHRGIRGHGNLILAF